jgi:hypothetical protein
MLTRCKGCCSLACFCMARKIVLNTAGRLGGLALDTHQYQQYRCKVKIVSLLYQKSLQIAPNMCKTNTFKPSYPHPSPPNTQSVSQQ